MTTSDLQMSKELKTELIQQCQYIVGNDLDGRRPLNIAVIGPPGCGKSAFLNTIFASFKSSDRAYWKEIAKAGDYGGHGIQETLRLRIYPKQDYIEDKDKHVLMPTFLDMTGFDNEETEINKELFCIFFNGKLKEGEDLSSPRDFFVNNERDVHRLRQFYSKRPVHARVDRIIVVCTANPDSPLPERLLLSIRETAKKGSREIPIYGVLTHADKEGSNDRQTKFKNHLGLINTRFKCITNYCTDFDPTESYISTTLPQLDIPVLKLMTQVLNPHPDDTPTPDKTNSWKKIAVVVAVAIINMLLAILWMIIS